MFEPYWAFWAAPLWMLAGIWTGWVIGVSGRSKTVGCPNCQERIGVFKFRDHFKVCVGS